MDRDSQLIFEAYKLLLEMPTISRQGTKVFAGEQRLKSLPLEAVKENIVIFRQEAANFLFPAGFTLAYFMDSVESAQKLSKGEIGYLIIHDRIRYAFNQSPITDVWKKKRCDKGQEHILGMIQGITDDKEIYVDKMSTRSPFRKNGIVSQLINAVKLEHPNAVVNFSGPTKQGATFINKYTGKRWEPAHGETAES